MKATVVIPAHNEGGGICRCLRSLIGEAGAEVLQVIVVCNACTDATAKLARKFGPNVHVVETATPGKANALNMGDRVAAGFPRFYVDADIELPIESIREVSRALADGEVLAAAPMMRVDLNGRPYAIRAFYQVWLALPYCRDGMVGSGVYAVSEAGRRRWGVFPAITADDGYARLHLAPHERKTVESCHFTIHAPRTLRDLIAIKTRAHFGNLELKARYPDLWKNEGSSHRGALARLAIRPRWWPAIAVYCFVRFLARRRAKIRFRSGDHNRWERDDSSRTPEPGPVLEPA
jgi:glycosyltransferase involved in cell wall biosynthesis